MIRFAMGATLWTVLVSAGLPAQSFSIPPRQPDFPVGTELVQQLDNLPLRQREERIIQEVLRGNVPSWYREPVPVTIRRRLGGSRVEVTFRAAPDYLVLGSDNDWFLTPLSPEAARRIGESIGAGLPTPAMVDAIWNAATVKLGPDSIAPGPEMITVPVFSRHNRMVRARRAANSAPLGALVAGHKKDVVVTPMLDSLPGRVAIYGWQRPDGSNIQALNTSHTTEHVDYSHGIRFILSEVMVDGTPHELRMLLRDPLLAGLLSDEGPIRGNDR